MASYWRGKKQSKTKTKTKSPNQPTKTTTKQTKNTPKQQQQNKHRIQCHTDTTKKPIKAKETKPSTLQSISTHKATHLCPSLKMTRSLSSGLAGRNRIHVTRSHSAMADSTSCLSCVAAVNNTNINFGWTTIRMFIKAIVYVAFYLLVEFVPRPDAVVAHHSRRSSLRAQQRVFRSEL